MKNTNIASVHAQMPSDIRSFTWVRNHHYVALKYVDGEEIKLDATTIMLCLCVDKACGKRFAVFTHEGEMACPHCKGPAEGIYVKPQLAFVAEHESMPVGRAGEK